MTRNINIIPLINTNYTSFTKAEKKVADLVLKDPKNVLYSSITDLAEAAKVGETTVLRFCRRLGLKGYQSFKMTLAQSTQPEDGMAEQLNNEIDANDSIEEISKKILSTNIAALNETFELIDYNALIKAVDAMSEASRVIFFGSGSSAISAHEASNKFMRITPYVQFVYDSHMQSMVASLMNSNEVAIAFSYSGSTKDTIEVLKTAKESGAKTICITRYSKSPITHYADIVLLTGAKEGPLQGGALATKIAQLYMIDLLYTEYFRKNSKLSKENKEKTAESISDKLL